ncbi:peptidase C19, ubiquitin carboxyl-terminal hydrolase 2 [Phlebopus sp. FC_14]|nr:peptidase C19, ubiquitin carboxyl-terminal hydrolase 2 [Phlebopus sp. FC_14]
MAKQKAPTPQELYRARKAREEREKNAPLPPGLVNHGNTCFMNSVLQGLIATQYLESLALFKPIPSVLQSPSSHTPLLSCKSPELTNGHGVGGDFELPWTAGLKIGDQFINVLQSAWVLQKERKRESISPKNILSALGEKYDQYMDFGQQDAHEFLRQLLDAMRMEELDIIKKRLSSSFNKSENQPSQPEGKCSTVHPADAGPQPVRAFETASTPHEELASFVDMLFGGKLASILVCQTCKHVSHTHEDFNDLSLSIKPEDYARERKRDRLKKLAKKLRGISGNALSVGIPTQRSSSVPATPVRDSALDSPEVSDPQRRRSIDLGDVDVSVEPAVEGQEGTLSIPVVQDTLTSREPSPPASGSAGGEESASPTPPAESVSANPHPADHASPPQPEDLPGDHVSFVETDRAVGKDKKDRDESWAKLGRRISVTVGFSKSSKEHRRRAKEEKREKKGSSQTSSHGSLQPLEEVSPSYAPSKGHSAIEVGNMTPNTTSEREPTALSAVNEKLQAQLANVKRSFNPSQRSMDSPTSSTPRFPLITRPSSPASHSKRFKLRPPKLSIEEAAYLRDILADINPPGLSRPFSIFRQSKDQIGTPPSNSQNIFLKLNQLGGVEECLRLFTAVEVLDGDNMVRCHRCWKIANGVYKPRPKECTRDSDSCTDTDDEDADRTRIKQSPSTSNPTLSRIKQTTSAVGPSDSVPLHSAISLPDTPKLQDTPQTGNTDLIPRTIAGSSNRLIPPSLQLNDDISPLEPTVSDTQSQTFSIPIPIISTTAPESPMSASTARPTSSGGNMASSLPTGPSLAAASSSRTSLGAPLNKHRREKDRGLDSTNESDGFSDEESETLLSAYSDISSAASPNASQECLEAPSQSVQDVSSKSESTSQPAGVPRSKQFIMRPAYKRYLIATPPPTLVIHLKRFQQTSKTPVVSFSTGFKKLDDYISFPEYLDLAPYLAPNREDYFGPKASTGRGRARRTDSCMYRLYAVVVHIGNMLGGHYIAYTALPASTSEADGRLDNEKRQHREPRDWAYISDTIVRLTSLEEVLKSKAYLCMYERI